MASANCPITTELISDYAAGRLEAEDVRVIEEAIGRDKAIATAIAAARKVNSRMIISFARHVEAEIVVPRQRRKKLRAGRGPIGPRHAAEHKSRSLTTTLSAAWNMIAGPVPRQGCLEFKGVNGHHLPSRAGGADARQFNRRRNAAIGVERRVVEARINRLDPVSASGHRARLQASAAGEDVAIMGEHPPGGASTSPRTPEGRRRSIAALWRGRPMAGGATPG